MDGAAMDRTLMRISHEIIERCVGNYVLLGIRRRGTPLAQLLADNILRFSGLQVPVAELNASAFRDDVTERTLPADFSLDLDVEGKTVVLVDDVLYTGRTIRAAMDAIITRGRPAAIRLAVLIDRGHRELPFRPDFVGKNIPTAKNEKVVVRVEEIDGETSVGLYSL